MAIAHKWKTCNIGHCIERQGPQCHAKRRVDKQGMGKGMLTTTPEKKALQKKTLSFLNTQ